MSQSRSRLARWTLRGVLLFGGVAGAWGLCDAVAGDAAQAAERIQPCLVGDLLTGDTMLPGGSVICSSYSPADRSRMGAPETAGDAVVAGSSRLATAVAGPARSTREKAPEHRTVTASAAEPGAERVVETLIPVTRPVVGLATDVVDTSATLVQPVGSVLQPVTQPIVDALPPALAPVLGLTKPIIGGPTAPPVALGGPVDVTPVPAEGLPTVGTIARPAPPTVAGCPAAPLPSAAFTRAGGDAASADAGEMTRRIPGVPPTASSSTAGSGCSAGGAGIPAGASPGSWSPDLRLVRCCASGCDSLVGVSRRPDTRPA